jgi:hypothetical protein
MKNPACNACHRAMDPIGFGLESFDALGAVQTTDNGARVVASGDVDGQPFDGPCELSRLVRAHPGAARCLTRGLVRHVLGAADPERQPEALDTLAADFDRSGRRLLRLLRALILSDAFRTAGD